MQTATVTFIWPQVSSLRESGLTIKATGFENDCHWTGQREFPSSDPNFSFWKWLHNNARLLPPVLDVSFVPALMILTETIPLTATLEPPPNGIYLNRESSGPCVSEAIDALTNAVGKSSIIDFNPSAATADLAKVMSVLCRGFAEVFVFQDGRCEFFGAIGQDREGIPMNIRLITKRAPTTPDSPPQASRG